MHRVATGTGLELRVEDWGDDGSGRSPVVLLHGFMGSAAAWGRLPSRLAEDRRVLVPELPGHGGGDGPTDPAHYRVERVARAVSAVVEALAPRPVDWVGYSMGGRILLAGWAEGSVVPRRVVLESSSPGLANPEARAERRRLDEERATRLEREGLERFVEGWMRLPLFASQRRLDPEARRRERDRRLVHDPAALAACLRGGGTGSQPSYWPALESLHWPALLLTGALDRKFGEIAGAMVGELPRARQSVVADAGHAVHLEAPGVWLEEVRAHLDRAD